LTTRESVQALPAPPDLQPQATAGGRVLRVLLFSTLYPSAERPEHGIFVETRLRELLKLGGVEVRVVAPVAWFPLRSPRFGARAAMARTPSFELRNGIEVRHPRYLLLPKIGMTSAPFLLALGALGTILKLRRQGFDFDLVDAHYYYPDGVAAALLSRWLSRPLAITARGTDLNLIPAHALPRRMIHWAAGRAHASIGVCAALVDVLRGMGVPPNKLHVFRNGVDLQRFRPLDGSECRSRLALPAEAPVLLSVGHLIERKGHHVLIAAMPAVLARWPKALLLIVGEGEERQRLTEQALALGVAASVRLVGRVPNSELAVWYSASDLLLLASSREGWANVLLEAMACGTPVVATRIWGTPEVVDELRSGRLVVERTGAAFAAAVDAMLSEPKPRADVRAYAENFSWLSTSEQQRSLFSTMAAQRLQA